MTQLASLFLELKHHSLTPYLLLLSSAVMFGACLCTVCSCLQKAPGRSVVALEAVDSIQLVLLVGEAAEPHRSFGGTAAPPGAGNGITYTPVCQPACIAAVVAQQLPGGKHLADLGDLSAIFLTSSHCFVVGQLGRMDQVVETTWRAGETGRWVDGN